MMQTNDIILNIIQFRILNWVDFNFQFFKILLKPLMLWKWSLFVYLLSLLFSQEGTTINLRMNQVQDSLEDF